VRAWIVVLGVAAGSYLLRVSMLVVAAHRGLPPVIERAARFALPVSFAAVAAASVATQVVTAGSVAPLVALTGGAVAAHRSRSPRLALVAGLPTMWLLTGVVAR
jgi:branched-subunit amino acid transport protein